MAPRRIINPTCMVDICHDIPAMTEFNCFYIKGIVFAISYGWLKTLQSLWESVVAILTVTLVSELMPRACNYKF